jgi:hypothetical protein
MDPISASLIGGAAASNLIGGYLGGRASKKANQKAMDMQWAAANEAIAKLEAVGIPSIEAQKIVLQQPEFAGLAEAVMLGDTQLAGVSTEASLAEARKNALRGLQERSTEGLTAEDKLRSRELRDQAVSRQQASEENILRSMAERGTLDSGAMLAQRLMASQGASQGQERAAMDLAAQASGNRMQALMQAAGLAGQIESDQYGRGRDLASARDAREQINAANTMDTQRFNLGRQDAFNINKANIANDQERYNKGLIRQNFLDEMNRARDIANIRTGQAASAAQSMQQIGQGQAQMYAGMGQGIGGALMAPVKHEQAMQIASAEGGKSYTPWSSWKS